MDLGKTYRIKLPFNKKANVFRVIEVSGSTARVEIVSGPRPYKGCTHCNIMSHQPDAIEV